MKTKSFLGIFLVCITLASVVSPAFAADTLLASDFKEESWAKIVDFFDYARAYALLHGMTVPQSRWHAYMYMTYVNTSGLQMLYAGLSNITFGGGAYLTIPMQTVMMHYKTENRSRDVLMASTFLMLMAFNETEQSMYPDSPDAYDKLWSSFSMGFNFQEKFPNASFPSLSSKTEIIPLTHSSDKLQWSWGMRYTNLTAIWWRTYISPTNHTYHSRPMALTTYDELTFTYTLTISPETNTATLTENHVIGRIRDLWHFWGWFLMWPLYNHYNSTGCYRYGRKISNETVYDFLQRNRIKMSIVNFQTSVMLDRNTYSLSSNGQNVTDNDVLVSDSFISTYADDGEKIFDASFGTKETYKLYNYTADSSEGTFDTYNATTRTCKINGFAQNKNLFVFHIGLMKFFPLLVANMRPRLFQKAKEGIANMTRANYFYLIAYPTYSGYRVVHDPTFTMYLSTPTSPTPPPAHPYLGLALIVTVVAVVVILVVMFARRRKPEQPSQPPELQTEIQPPTS
jgi:hypothetical protein